MGVKLDVSVSPNIFKGITPDRHKGLKNNDTYKFIRFGQQGVKGAGKAPKTAKDKARKKSYYARHDAQGKPTSKLSAKYWSHKVKW